MQTEARFHRGMVRRLHQAALDPAGWQGVIAQLQQGFPGATFSLHGLDLRMGGVFLATHCGFDSRAQPAYLAHFHAINPFVAASRSMAFGAVRRSYLDISDEALVRSEFYNDWLRPQDDLFGAVALKLPPVGGRTLILAANVRRRDRDRLEPRLQGFLARLAPDLGHAFQVGEAIAGLDARLAHPGAAPEPRGGVILVDGAGKVTWISDAAAALGGRLFRIDLLGRLRFADDRVQDWALAMLRDLGRAPAAGARMQPGIRPGIGLSCQGQGWRIQASLPPRDAPGLWRGSPVYPASLAAAGPARLVFVLSPGGHASPPEQRLIDRFGLTPAEAGIALLAAEGLSTAEMAQMRQTSLHTVRNQIRMVLHKTESRSRSDIARLVTMVLAGEPPRRPQA